MKRCPTCNRRFADQSLSFCLDDGTPLVPDTSGDEATVVSPRTGGADNRNLSDQEWHAVEYQPPGSYVPPGSEPSKRKAWPWVLGMLGLVVAGLLGLGIGAIILLPRLWRSDQQTVERRQAPNVNEQTSQTPNDSNADSASEAPTPSNHSNSNSSNLPPTDEEQVLTHLTELENEWTAANLNADKKALDRILADDYVGTISEGRLLGKAEYIKTIERDLTVEKWEFDDLKLVLHGDRATLSGNITYFTQGREVVFDFTDKFVWRAGRWQATGSEVKLRQ